MDQNYIFRTPAPLTNYMSTAPKPKLNPLSEEQLQQMKSQMASLVKPGQSSMPLENAQLHYLAEVPEEEVNQNTVILLVKMMNKVVGSLQELYRTKSEEEEKYKNMTQPLVEHVERITKFTQDSELELIALTEHHNALIKSYEKLESIVLPIEKTVNGLNSDVSNLKAEFAVMKTKVSSALNKHEELDSKLTSYIRDGITQKESLESLRNQVKSLDNLRVTANKETRQNKDRLDTIENFIKSQDDKEKKKKNDQKNFLEIQDEIIKIKIEINNLKEPSQEMVSKYKSLEQRIEKLATTCALKDDVKEIDEQIRTVLDFKDISLTNMNKIKEEYYKFQNEYREWKADLTSKLGKMDKTSSMNPDSLKNMEEVIHKTKTSSERLATDLKLQLQQASIEMKAQTTQMKREMEECRKFLKNYITEEKHNELLGKVADIKKEISKMDKSIMEAEARANENALTLVQAAAGEKLEKKILYNKNGMIIDVTDTLKKNQNQNDPQTIRIDKEEEKKQTNNYISSQPSNSQTEWHRKPVLPRRFEKSQQKMTKKQNEPNETFRTERKLLGRLESLLERFDGCSNCSSHYSKRRTKKCWYGNNCRRQECTFEHPKNYKSSNWTNKESRKGSDFFSNRRKI